MDGATKRRIGFVHTEDVVVPTEMNGWQSKSTSIVL